MMPAPLVERTRTNPPVTDAGRRVTARLRLAFLVPLAAVLLGVIVALVAGLYYHEHEEVRQNVVRLRASALELYQDELRNNTAVLRTVMEVLARDGHLREALTRRDRVALRDRAVPIAADLKRNYGITHLYFTDPAGVVLLRAFQPERHGDVLAHAVVELAARVGKTAHGVELGRLGTFTLRLAAPWRAERTHQLLGYVELGMEIDHVLAHLRGVFGVETYVVIRKAFLDRKAWEDGMRRLGRTPDWDRFPDVVLSVHGEQAVPPWLAEQLARDSARTGPILELRRDGKSHRALFQPVTDIAERNVGQLVLVADVTHDIAAVQRTAYTGSAVAFATGGALAGFFWWLVGRIGRRLERDEKELQRLATHDGLTGLYNHRTFYTLLEDEIARAKRFNRPVSLLMLDIDHFKRVNDTHGHLAGDAILEGLSELLIRQARAIDRVCRYGGEEITVILPETENAAALNIAERLRASVEQEPFDIGEGRIIHVSVSIGLVSWPAQARDAETLIATADTAMYAAKQAGRNRVCRWETGMAAAGN